MKVIVASYPKCGTKTLHKCLEILGYSVADFDHHCTDYREEWKKILLYGSTKDQILRLYKDIDVVCDFPAGYYWEEIAKAFPEAKGYMIKESATCNSENVYKTQIILTTRRNENEWLCSFKNQMKLVDDSWLLGLCYVFTPTGRKVREHFRRLGRVAYGCPEQGVFTTMQQPNAQLMKRRYREYNASVLSSCHKQKLLHFHLSDGWEPLCRFLQREVPEQEFPHENKKGALASSQWDLYVFAKMRRELFIIIAGMLVFVGYCLQLFLHW